MALTKLETIFVFTINKFILTGACDCLIISESKLAMGQPQQRQIAHCDTTLELARNVEIHARLVFLTITTLDQKIFQEMTFAGNEKIAGFDLFSSKAVVKSYPFANLFRVNKDENMKPSKFSQPIRQYISHSN